MTSRCIAPTALKCLREGLEIATDIQVVGLILDALLGIATLSAKEGETEQAVELAAHVMHHPTVNVDVSIKRKAEHILSELELAFSRRVRSGQGKGRDSRFRILCASL
jgi:NAD(P)H-hydrate repair Nnr-like enzyme with NAD(P)H-hydrate epimerase domain